MDFDDLITALGPPPNRVGKHTDEHEHHLYEGAVMVAYAMHLLRSPHINEVRIHPDGEHGKQFDFASWLNRRGFAKTSKIGGTAYGGIYADQLGRSIVVNPKSGQGDVVAAIGDQVIFAECKGGIINTRHSGQKSRLYRGLCEAVGLLMATAASPGRRVAVVPYTKTTVELAERLAPRCAQAGIEIALVKSRGEVIDVRPA
jgi:hypothetical protein